METYDLERPVPRSDAGGARLLVGAVVAIAILLAVASPWLLHNQLVAADAVAETQWHQVEVQLQRQHELLPKLAAVARRYAEYESGVIDKVLAAQGRYESASPAARPEAAAEVDKALIGVLSLASRYPELGADGHYRDLAHEISGTKSRIAVERMRYNAAAGALNARLRQFPWQWVRFGIEPREFYPVPESHLEDPQLEL
jgi:LemA protein